MVALDVKKMARLWRRGSRGLTSTSMRLDTSCPVRHTSASTADVQHSSPPLLAPRPLARARVKGIASRVYHWSSRLSSLE